MMKRYNFNNINKYLRQNKNLFFTALILFFILSAFSILNAQPPELKELLIQPSYLELSSGESYELADIKITAKYSNGGTRLIDTGQCKIRIKNGEIKENKYIAPGQACNVDILVSYQENGKLITSLLKVKVFTAKTHKIQNESNSIEETQVLHESGSVSRAESTSERELISVSSSRIEHDSVPEQAAKLKIKDVIYLSPSHDQIVQNEFYEFNKVKVYANNIKEPVEAEWYGADGNPVKNYRADDIGKIAFRVKYGTAVDKFILEVVPADPNISSIENKINDGQPVQTKKLSEDNNLSFLEKIKKIRGAGKTRSDNLISSKASKTGDSQEENGCKPENETARIIFASNCDYIMLGCFDPVCHSLRIARYDLKNNRWERWRSLGNVPPIPNYSSDCYIDFSVREDYKTNEEQPAGISKVSRFRNVSSEHDVPQAAGMEPRQDKKNPNYYIYSYNHRANEIYICEYIDNQWGEWRKGPDNLIKFIDCFLKKPYYVSEPVNVSFGWSREETLETHWAVTWFQEGLKGGETKKGIAFANGLGSNPPFVSYDKNTFYGVAMYISNEGKLLTRLFFYNPAQKNLYYLENCGAGDDNSKWKKFDISTTTLE